MENKLYDTFIIGHISLDEICENDSIKRIPGGAVMYSSYSAKASGYKVGVCTKIAEEHKDLLSLFPLEEEDIFFIPSKESTSIRNEFLSADRERRICTALSIADQFVLEDIPCVEAKIYHLAGLMLGDFDNLLIKELSQKGKVALDVQGYVRRPINGVMVYKDWEEKKEYLPYIHFLKTDAAEAEVMTGTQDRYAAAKTLYDWGAKEIMITHNTEVIIYDGKDFYSAPLKPKNLSGRTGRGDTCFSAYITGRLDKEPSEAVLYAAALVSLKMETPGPFKGTRRDVEEFINTYY